MTRCDCKWDGERWVCSVCKSRYRGGTKPPVAECLSDGGIPLALEKAADQLGLSVQDAIHYAAALARWSAGGFRVRDQAEVERIERDSCRPCNSYREGRCAECGCRVTASRMPLANKIKMATESCPKGKW